MLQPKLYRQRTLLKNIIPLGLKVTRSVFRYFDKSYAKSDSVLSPAIECKNNETYYILVRNFTSMTHLVPRKQC